MPTFVPFHKLGFCAHVPIRQGTVATGQSEPRDNEDVEGPGSEITGHLENEDPLTESWNSQNWRKAYSASGGKDAVLTFGYCDYVLNDQTDTIDESRREEGRLSDDADVIWFINPL